MEFYEISWDEVMKMVKLLAVQVQGKRIIGIPRGGSIVAGLMSFYGCELVASLAQTDVIVDDIADQGRTLQPFIETTAALVVREGCVSEPDCWVMKIATERYILFPWEDKLEVVLQSGFRSRDI